MWDFLRPSQSTTTNNLQLWKLRFYLIRWNDTISTNSTFHHTNGQKHKKFIKLLSNIVMFNKMNFFQHNDFSCTQPKTTIPFECLLQNCDAKMRPKTALKPKFMRSSNAPQALCQRLLQLEATHLALTAVYLKRMLPKVRMEKRQSSSHQDVTNSTLLLKLLATNQALIPWKERWREGKVLLAAIFTTIQEMKAKAFFFLLANVTPTIHKEGYTHYL